MAHVVIAVRGGPQAKVRCAGLVTADGRAALTIAMLGDMLDAIALTEGVTQTWVVTPTPELAALAAGYGAQSILESRTCGLAGAFDRVRKLIALYEPNCLSVLLPGDLPLLDPAELGGLIASWKPGEILLVAAKGDGGTGAIGLAADRPFAFAYGQNSFARHVVAARQTGLFLRQMELPSLAFDLDQPSDIPSVLAYPGANRSRAVLNGAHFKSLPPGVNELEPMSS